MGKTISLKEKEYYELSRLRVDIEKEREKRVTFNSAINHLLECRMKGMNDYQALVELIEKHKADAEKWMNDMEVLEKEIEEYKKLIEIDIQKK